MNKMTMLLVFLVLAVSLPCAVAQNSVKAIKAETFAPEGYDFEMRVDLDALMDSGAWDVVERPMARIPIEEFWRQHGFALMDLSLVRMCRKSIQVLADQKTAKSVLVMQGKQTVSLAKAKMLALVGSSEQGEIGSRVLCFNDYTGYISPQAGLVVSGTADVLRDVLSGGQVGAFPVTNSCGLLRVSDRCSNSRAFCLRSGLMIRWRSLISVTRGRASRSLHISTFILQPI